MKSSVAIALIVCGTVSIMTPAGYNFVLQRTAANVLLSRTDFTSYHGGELMSSMYQFVCWLMGAVMIGIAVVQSVRLPKPAAPSMRPAAG
jgi:hypothetical protein